MKIEFLHVSTVESGINMVMDLENSQLYCLVVLAAEIRDHETGLVSGPFLWFQSRQIFCETHETETNPIFLFFRPQFAFLH